MKKIFSLLITAVILITVCGCEKDYEISKAALSEAGLTSRMENSIELQKNLFTAKIISSAQTDALISKYNLDITKYMVYTVEITESHDGITPLGEATVMCAGTSEEFFSRLSLSKNETYILDAEPWVYDGKIVYLLSVFTTAYPKIDTAGRVTLAQSENNVVDCGTKEQYLSELESTRQAFADKNQGFFENQNTLARLEEIFANINQTNAKQWQRDGFEYDWTPSEQLVADTRDASQKVCDYIETLKQKSDITSADLTAIFEIL